MNIGPQLLLIGAVAAVGVLHTLVPDHWAPITLMARQRNWSKKETALVALQAGAGHVASTLAVALVVWFAGKALAARFGTLIDTASSVALVVFGAWIALSAWREQHHHAHHALSHAHIHGKRQDQPNAARIPGGKDGSRNRNALPLILGSSPMVEGIPAFFAAVKYGVGLIAIMAMVFAASTITTYVLICISSTAVLQRLRSGVLERHGEVLSGAAIAIVGLVFWLWPLAL